MSVTSSQLAAPLMKLVTSRPLGVASRKRRHPWECSLMFTSIGHCRGREDVGEIFAALCGASIRCDAEFVSSATLHSSKVKARLSVYHFGG
jgi:hypothetical protein